MALKGDKMSFPYAYINNFASHMKLKNKVNSADDLLDIDRL